MAKNILLPLSLLEKIVELLGYWNISGYDCGIRDDYDSIMQELSMKMQKLELRDAYTKIICAKDEDARHSARMEYLWQKNYIRSAYGGDS
jgi:hypothetical protein